MAKKDYIKGYKKLRRNSISETWDACVKYIERVIIEAPAVQSMRVRDWAYANGYTMVSSGPKMIGPGKCNPNVLRYICERPRK